MIVHLQLSDIAKGWYDRGNREEVMTCSVCLKDLENGMEFSRFRCSHMFHRSCVDRWLGKNRSCPNCRYKLKITLIFSAALTLLCSSTTFRHVYISWFHVRKQTEC